MRLPRKLPPLTEEQRSLVESQIGDACSIAHGVWRDAKLPASMLEEMRAEALLILCDCCARNGVGTSGKVLCGIQIKGRMIEMIREWRRSKLPPPAEHPLARPDGVDDPRITLALKLISWLPERQREVIEMRFGLAGPPLSNREVAAKLGIGDAGASGLHAKALRKLTEWASWEIWESFKREGEGAG